MFYIARLPLDSFIMITGQPSYETAIRMIIKWTGLVILATGALGTIIKWLHWMSTVYTAINRRILTKTGIVIKSYTDCSFSRIQTLQMRISLPGRILNYGTIKIDMDGKGAAVITWENLKKPKSAFRQLSEIIEEYRQNKVSKEP